MNEERIQELAALNALGALSDADHQEFQDLLAGADAGVKQQVTDMLNVAGLVGSTLAGRREPSPALKNRIMERIQASPRREAAAAPPRFSTQFESEGEWKDMGVPGARSKVLAVDKTRDLAVILVELAAGARFPGHHHTRTEECYVLSGDLHLEGSVLGPGDFHHAEGNTNHGESYTERGCRVLLVVDANEY